MITLKTLKANIFSDPANWEVHFMDFVDDFRRHKNKDALSEPFGVDNSKWDALLAATAASLCDEVGVPTPTWILEIPSCSDPWFVSGMESLKAIALVESPLQFRLRNIFVLDNFLSRV